ncbi:MAG: hypothetical protein Q8O63_09930 [Hoeflea sp.]|nr:hypothetical protein [Hoeflea sp.]
MIAETSKPSPELLLMVRAAMIVKGTSFNAWCKSRGIVRRTAEQALTGENQSENARNLVRRIVKEVENGR